jgi:hypothetical protein
LMGHGNRSMKASLTPAKRPMTFLTLTNGKRIT